MSRHPRIHQRIHQRHARPPLAGPQTARPDAGMISAFVAVAMVGVFAVLGLGLDPGLAFADKVETGRSPARPMFVDAAF